MPRGAELLSMVALLGIVCVACAPDETPEVNLEELVGVWNHGGDASQALEIDDAGRFVLRGVDAEEFSEALPFLDFRDSTIDGSGSVRIPAENRFEYYREVRFAFDQGDLGLQDIPVFVEGEVGERVIIFTGPDLYPVYEFQKESEL